MRVLVTGAFGFVGHAVALHLLESGHEVTALTSRRNASWPGPSDRAPHHAAVVDVRDADSLRTAVAGSDAVCHLAALTRVRESFERPDEYAAVNTGGTRNLLEAVAATGRPLPFVHASSAVVYGTPEAQPIGEDCETAPSSPYGVTKLDADLLVKQYTQTGRVAGVSLRILNASGAAGGYGDADTTRIIPKAVAVAAGLFPEVGVNGDGTAILDFVHVADVAAAFGLALDAAGPGAFAVYNLGATPATVAGIVETVRRITGRPIPVVHNPPAPEAPELRADTTRIRAELGWKPQRSSLEEIVADAWEAVRDGVVRSVPKSS